MGDMFKRKLQVFKQGIFIRNFGFQSNYELQVHIFLQANTNIYANKYAKNICRNIV